MPDHDFRLSEVCFGVRPDLQQLLKDTSRSFYLSLRLLPSGSREATGLAYLLARAADTVADTDAAPVSQRKVLLEALRDAFLADAPPPSATLEQIAANVEGQGVTRAERELLRRLPDAIQLLSDLDPTQRREVYRVLATLTHGMVLDLTWFPDGERRALDPVALRDLGMLDAYCFHVAGVVGSFWTRVNDGVRGGVAPTGRAALEPLGVRYGIGLQLINVIRDFPRDFARGRCYLPNSLLTEARLTPSDLLRPERWQDAQPAIHTLLQRALEGLAAGRRYCRLLPKRSVRLRLASGLPMLIGLRTIEVLANSPSVLDPSATLKVSRGEVYRLLAVAGSRAGSPHGFDAFVGRILRAAREAVERIRPDRNLDAR